MKSNFKRLEKKWTLRVGNAPVFKSDKISIKLAEILAKRGIENEAQALKFLFPEYEDLSDPFLLTDMDNAVEIIKSSIANNKKIAIYGDYDVDGITGTALLVTFFREIGIDVFPYIPSRYDEGYGLNKGAIDTLLGKEIDLIITVDCGSTSFEEIDYAKEKGMKIVVTDHHSLKKIGNKVKLPLADAIINPKRSLESSPFFEIAGVGVAFYLVRALQNSFSDKFQIGQEKWLLDFVALGTICDVVPLMHDNRIFAKYGLKVLAKSKRPGLIELAKVAGFNIENIDAYKIGFLLGPRLNASGRVEHASISLDLMTTSNEEVARDLAGKLDELNRIRQEMTETIVLEAKNIISGLDGKRKIFLLSKENWPSGVLGIVASRLVEEFGKPVLLMEEEGENLRGSARSIKNFNILDALTRCSEYFVHFGGHSAAAGFSLKKEHFLVLDEKLLMISENEIKEEDLKQEIYFDGEIGIDDINKNLVDELKLLEPFGRDNTKPVFYLRKVAIENCRLVGKELDHLKYTVSKNSTKINGIAFNFGQECAIRQGQFVDILCTLEENEWANQVNIETRAIDIKPV